MSLPMWLVLLLNVKHVSNLSKEKNNVRERVEK